MECNGNRTSVATIWQGSTISSNRPTWKTIQSNWTAVKNVSFGNDIVSVNESIMYLLLYWDAVQRYERNGKKNICDFHSPLVCFSHLLAEKFQKEEISRRHQMQQTGYQQNNYCNAKFSAATGARWVTQTKNDTWKRSRRSKNVTEICNKMIIIKIQSTFYESTIPSADPSHISINGPFWLRRRKLHLLWKYSRNSFSFCFIRWFGVLTTKCMFVSDCTNQNRTKWNMESIIRKTVFGIFLILTTVILFSSIFQWNKAWNSNSGASLISDGGWSFHRM